MATITRDEPVSDFNKLQRFWNCDSIKLTKEHVEVGYGERAVDVAFVLEVAQKSDARVKLVRWKRKNKEEKYCPEYKYCFIFYNYPTVEEESKNADVYAVQANRPR